MSQDLLTPMASAGATALVAIVAIITNDKGLDDPNKRLDDTNAHMARLENKLDHIEDLSVSYTLDMARIKEKLGT